MNSFAHSWYIDLHPVRFLNGYIFMDASSTDLLFKGYIYNGRISESIQNGIVTMYTHDA